MSKEVPLPMKAPTAVSRGKCWNKYTLAYATLAANKAKNPAANRDLLKRTNQKHINQAADVWPEGILLYSFIKTPSTKCHV